MEVVQLGSKTRLWWRGLLSISNSRLQTAISAYHCSYCCRSRQFTFSLRHLRSGETAMDSFKSPPNSSFEPSCIGRLAMILLPEFFSWGRPSWLGPSFLRV